MIKLNGYFKGNTWNKETRKFELKKIGTAEAGAILCGMNVSGKDKEGSKVYGKPLDVKINIKSQEEGKRVWKLIQDGEGLIECEGFFVPNNWTKDDKEVKGNQFLVNKSNTFILAGTTPKEEVVADIDNSEIPF